MGYRSEIVMIFSKDALDGLCEKHRDMYTWLHSVTTERKENYGGEGATLFHIDSIKWYYHTFPEVKFFSDLFTGYETNPEKYSIDMDEYRFIRIGDSFDDSEEWGYLCSDDVYVVRKMSISK